MLTPLALLVAAAQAQPSPPPIAANTARSGGPVEADRAALHLTHADLAIEAIPARRMLSGRATLTVTARAATPRIVLDLDDVLPVWAVRVDGVRLPRDAWRHGDGRIVVDRPLSTGQRVVIGIDYAGSPRIAKRAPWDDGFVWSQWNGKPWFASTAQGKGCDLWWPCLDFPAGEPDV